MEEFFKKIIKKTKDWNEGQSPLSRTFEGALFKETSWPFIFMEDKDVFTEEIDKKKRQMLPQEKISKILFVGDTYNPSLGKEDLLGKMIQAMKLTPEEYQRYGFNLELEKIENLEENLLQPSLETAELFNQIKTFAPEIVITLGAGVTNILLGKREKLSSIHGVFFKTSLNFHEEIFSYEIFPLFHPDFLLINPNMKRTAWIDLQKIMERMGKI